MSSDNRSLAALLAGFALLLVMIVASVWVASQQVQSLAAVRRTLDVESRLTAVLSSFQDAESGQRGYLLTGQDRFLAPYDEAMIELATSVDGLAEVTAESPRQAVDMALLRRLAAEREAGLRRAVGQYRAGDRATATDPSHLVKGMNLMDQIRAVIGRMEAEEQGQLRAREQTALRQAELAQAGLAVNGLVILFLVYITYRQAGRRLSVARGAAAELLTANQSLKQELESRQSAESQNRQMQKMESLGQLTGGIAHDFNNMLTIVIGSLDIAKRRLDSDRLRALVLIDNALDGAHRAAVLTARLLAFSRLQPLEPRIVDINRLVGGMSEMLRHTIGEQLRVETVLAGGLWTAVVDPSQLENAILNLVINARDAMPAGGRLTVETANAHLDDAYAAINTDATPGQYVLVTVSDSGTGMPPEVAARVFDPFFTTKGVGRGTGLGLSQVHGFVKQSGGHVKIYSEPGVGTTVKVYLPRHIGAATELEISRPAPLVTSTQARDGEVILVVEDDEKIRYLSVEALRDFGYQVFQAGDASQALAILATQSRVDLLFTDIVMPDMNGRQLADQARGPRPDLKVLYTTGFTKNAVVHNGVLDAGVSLIPKPFTVDQLATKVRRVLDGEAGNRNA